MKQLSTRLNMSGVNFPFCNTVEVVSSYENLTDTAKIIVPKKIKFRKSDGTAVTNITKGEDALFKRGDEVSVELGYDHNIKERFKGFLTGIKTKFPLEFICEDEMYFLKQSNITLTLKNPQLSDLLKRVIPEGIDYTVTAKQNLGDFRITNATPARVLDELRKKHGIYSFFRDGILYVGLAVVPQLQKTVRFTMFKDIINPDGLKFINDFDRKIQVVAKSINNDNKTLTATVGDDGGDKRTLYFYNIQTIDQLEAIAKSKIEGLKYSGYEGAFTTFQTPSVNHGDIIEIVNPQIVEQSGGYICNKVTLTSGVSGGRQSINIKQKVYDLVQNSAGEWLQAVNAE